MEKFQEDKRKTTKKYFLVLNEETNEETYEEFTVDLSETDDMKVLPN